MNERFKELLQSGQDDWNDENVETAPASVYLFQLQEAEMYEDEDKDGNPTIKIRWEHLIREGEYEGTVITDRSSPMHEMPFVRKMCRDRIRAFGFEPPEDRGDLEEVIAAIRAAMPCYRGKLTWKNGFSNVAVKELVEAPAGRRPAAKPAAKPAAARPAASKPAARPAAPAEEAASGFAVGDAVEFEMDGATVQATVTSASGDSYMVEDAEGNRYEADGDSLQATGGGGGEEPAAEEGGDDAENLRLGLIEFAQAQDLEVTDASTTEELLGLLNGYEWQEQNLTPDELALLQGAGVEVKAKPKPPQKKPPARKPAPAKAPAKKAPARAKPKAAGKGARRK